MLSAWTSELGVSQGRIAPAGFTPSEGSFAFVLGNDLPGLLRRLEPGDFAELKQQADFGDAKLVRVRVRLRPPTRAPEGAAWKASIRIDGEQRAAVLLIPGRTRDLADMAVNVSKLSGTHELAFRLELAAV